MGVSFAMEAVLWSPLRGWKGESGDKGERRVCVHACVCSASSVCVCVFCQQRVVCGWEVSATQVKLLPQPEPPVRKEAEGITGWKFWLLLPPDCVFVFVCMTEMRLLGLLGRGESRRYVRLPVRTSRQRVWGHRRLRGVHPGRVVAGAQNKVGHWGDGRLKSELPAASGRHTDESWPLLAVFSSSSGSSSRKCCPARCFSQHRTNELVYHVDRG